MAEITTMASSTKSPSDNKSEKVARNDKAIPVICITIKVTKKVTGMESIDTIACLIPKNKRSTKNTSAITIEMSRCRVWNSSSISSAVLMTVEILKPLPLWVSFSLTFSWAASFATSKLTLERRKTENVTELETFPFSSMKDSFCSGLEISFTSATSDKDTTWPFKLTLRPRKSSILEAAGSIVKEKVPLLVRTLPAGKELKEFFIAPTNIWGFNPKLVTTSGLTIIWISCSSNPVISTLSIVARSSSSFFKFRENLIRLPLSFAPDSEKTQIGWLSKSSFWTLGVRASSGKSVIASTADWTSLLALSGSNPDSNSILTIETDSREVEVTVLTPLMPLTASSTGTLINDSISVGLAPGKTVEIRTIGILISGLSLLGKAM